MTVKSKASPLDQKLVRRFAHAMWSAAFTEASPQATPDERKKNWAEARRDHTIKARKFIRQLQRDGIDLNVAA